jgi:short-subunit dehydrogenase
MNKSVVITGAGSGLGRNLALNFANRGFDVYGTASKQEQIDDLDKTSNGKVKLFICDITDTVEINNLAIEVNKLTNDTLDYLISNAGILTPGPLEVQDLAEVRREFKVNTFGVLSVVNAFLPALRNSKGRIIQISTATVDFPSPFNGLSAGSKAATEAFMSVYRDELKQFGIEVIVAVPGNMKTGGPAKTAAALEKVRESFTPEQKELYGESYDKFIAKMNEGQSHGTDADISAEHIVNLATRNPVLLREPIGDDAIELLKYVKSTTLEEQSSHRVKSISNQ